MDLKARHTLSIPTKIRFGPGVSDELGDYLKVAQLKRPLLVADKNLCSLPFFKKIFENLKAKHLRPMVFSQIDRNPVKKNVLEGKTAFLKHRGDSVVAVGGGASMDTARAIVLASNHERDLFDFDDALGGEKFVVAELPHFVCVPTTAGTGSEVGRSAVISEDNTKRKRILFSPKLMASMVFADPELTMELPPHITAATGMDALTHNVEAFVAKGFNPICDGIALEGVRLIGQSLLKSFSAPDLESRAKMMIASLMGATAFQKGLGVVHSCAHPLSTKYDAHHGLANSIMLPAGIKYNQIAAAEKFKVLAAAVGTGDFERWTRELAEKMRLPLTLKSLGVDEDGVDELAKLAMADPCHGNNPRELNEEDFKHLYREVMA